MFFTQGFKYYIYYGSTGTKTTYTNDTFTLPLVADLHGHKLNFLPNTTEKFMITVNGIPQIAGTDFRYAYAKKENAYAHTVTFAKNIADTDIIGFIVGGRRV